MHDAKAGCSRRGFCQAAGAALAGVAMGRWPAFGQEAELPAKVKIGLIDSLFREHAVWQVMFALRPFQAYLQAQMGVAGELAQGGDALEMGKGLREKKLQLGVFHGLEFAWAKQRYSRLRPLFIAVNGETALRAQLLVRADSDFRNVKALEGKTLRLPGRGREHCWVFLERRCTKPGVAPNKHFSLSRSGGADEVLDDLAGGNKVHAAVVDGIDYEAWKKANPAKAGTLRPLLTSEPFPCALIAHYGHELPEAMLQKFKTGMLAAHKTAQGQLILKLMRLTGFQDVPKDYGDQLAAVAKAYPMKI